LTVRYLIKFSKESEIKFISHLDLMKTIMRMIKRAELPINHSKGFNPHMDVSIAQPLSVGMYSVGEYADIVLNEEIDPEEIKVRLIKSSPIGIKILDVKIIEELPDKKYRQSMALIDAAKYSIKIKYDNLELLKQEMQSLFLITEWNIIKKSKNGEKEVDIKPLIINFDYFIDTKDRILNITAVVYCGSKENLSADLLSRYIKEHTSSVSIDSFTDIKREEMYAFDNNKKLLPLNEFVVELF
jgi:radical SAM-linked protein